MSVLWYHLKCANYAIYGPRNHVHRRRRGICVKRLSLKGLINFKIVWFLAIRHVAIKLKLTAALRIFCTQVSTQFQIAFDNL